jgi:K+-sensing histidine kinase KdpD
VSHELRNPLSAIVQSSDVVLNSLTSILMQEELAPNRVHEISDDIDTMRSIVLCTMHMRRLIDDTINVDSTANCLADIRFPSLRTACYKSRQSTVSL